jgi:hypothetical protein
MGDFINGTIEAISQSIGQITTFLADIVNNVIAPIANLANLLP